MKRTLMTAIGGTIISKWDASGLKPPITSKEILSYVPDIREFCQTDTLQLLDIDSTNIQLMYWLAMTDVIEERYTEYDGFAICHGTDTVAYTAAVLFYLIQNSRKSIVVTGAQKPIDMEITDAKTNLSDSLLLVSHDSAYDVSIVFNGKVIAGTRGKKERTKSCNAFSSINSPYIVSTQDDRVIFYLGDENQLDEPVTFYHKLNSSIALSKLIPFMDATVPDYMAGHYDAAIIESFGMGGLPPYEIGAYHLVVEKWASLGKTVAMVTQATNEGSNTPVYEVGHSIKQEFGLLEAYDVTLEATVTKLMRILGQTEDAANVHQLFYITINRDVLWR